MRYSCRAKAKYCQPGPIIRRKGIRAYLAYNTSPWPFPSPSITGELSLEEDPLITSTFGAIFATLAGLKVPAQGAARMVISTTTYRYQGFHQQGCPSTGVEAKLPPLSLVKCPARRNEIAMVRASRSTTMVQLPLCIHQASPWTSTSLAFLQRQLGGIYPDDCLYVVFVYPDNTTTTLIALCQYQG